MSSKKISGGGLTKGQIIERVAGNTSLSAGQVREMFGHLARAAESGLRERDEFRLPGIGRFVRRERAARTGRNPQTGEAIDIPARHVVKLNLQANFVQSALPGNPNIPAPGRRKKKPKSGEGVERKPARR